MRGLPKGDRPDPVRARAAPLPVSRDLHGDVLALNNAHAVELSWLEPGELFALLGQAFYARRVGKVDAFLLAFDQDATYDSPNYRWFCERYPRFVYVDRVVVTKAARGRGLARLLYGDLFRCAGRRGWRPDEDGGAAGAAGFHGDGRSGAADAERARSRGTRQRDDVVAGRPVPPFRPYIP